jgi:SWI/SNF-related matrix-associated actin-dependent regulator 1 of chromatin subfamily A
MPSPVVRARALADGLFPHQVEGLAFLLGRRRAILADDMGLGKTRQAIVALREAAPDGPYLVVSPASVKRNWAREIDAVAPGASVRLISTPSDSSGLDAVSWVIVNYDILGKHIGNLQQTAWAGIVFDEAHYLKNRTSQRSKLAERLAGGARGSSPHVYLLTGTPLTNRPRDLFPLLKLCNHAMGRSFLSFAKRYCAAEHNGYGWVTDGASNLEELAVELRGVMLRRRKDEVLDLPPKIRTWNPVEVPEGTGRAEMRKVLSALIGGRTGRVAPRVLKTAGGDAQEASRGQLLANLTVLRQKLSVAKVKSTIEFIEGAVEQDEKVLVFSCFDEPVKTIAKHFGDVAVTLTGATPTAKRQDLVDRFQTDDTVRVFVANIQAGGVGQNLTAARQVVFNDLDWVPANHWQAEDRAYRIGQTGAVNVTYMVGAETVDDFVQTVLETKGMIVDAVIEGGALGEIPDSVLTQLERLMRSISPELADAGGKSLDDEAVATLIRRATEASRKEGLFVDPRVREAGGSHGEAWQKALEALARALGGPTEERYRTGSTRGRGVFYTLVVEADGDVSCSCPGFEYRGMCSHARTLKSALATGQGAPAAYERLTGS